MPKRTNNFQQLVYLIHHQLADNAKVTESKSLLDQASNAEREVDIVIETQVGDYSILISVECQGRGRVANIEWVEQMIAKHQTLPTNKLILVSQSGFTPAALRKAKALDIEAITLTKAIEADWKVMTGLDKIILRRWAIEPSACFAIYQGSSNETLSIQLEMNYQLINTNDDELITVEEIFGVFLDMTLESIGQNIKKKKTDDKQNYIVFTLESHVPENTFFIDDRGKKQKIIYLRFVAHAREEDETITMQNNSFGSAQISFGKTKDIHRNALVSIVETKDKPNTATIMIRTDKEKVEDIVNLREVKPPNGNKH